MKSHTPRMCQNCVCVRIVYHTATTSILAEKNDLNFSVATYHLSILRVVNILATLLSIARRIDLRSGSRLKPWRICVIVIQDCTN